jgi:hypothetical protein
LRFSSFDDGNGCSSSNSKLFLGASTPKSNKITLLKVSPKNKKRERNGKRATFWDWMILQRKERVGLKNVRRLLLKLI